MEIEIRELKEKEMDLCVAVICQGFLTVAKEFGLTEENCPTNGAFMKKERLETERAKGNLMYVAVYEGIIVGFMQLEKSSEELYFLQKLVVLPDYRHLGIGKRLLDFAGAKATELGGKKISIGIIEENTVLKNWYMNYGFVTTGVRKFEHLPFTVGFMELEI